MLNIQELKNYAVIVSKENPVQEVKPEDVSPDVEILDAPQASTSAYTQEIKEEEESPRRSARGKTLVEKKVLKGKGKGKTKAKAKGKGKKKVKDEDYEDEDEEEEDEGADLSYVVSRDWSILLVRLTVSVFSDNPSNALNAQLQTFLSAASLATDTDTQEAQQDVKVKVSRTASSANLLNPAESQLLSYRKLSSRLSTLRKVSNGLSSSFLDSRTEPIHSTFRRPRSRSQRKGGYFTSPSLERQLT